MTPEQFKEWRVAMGYRSRDVAADALGLSRSTVELYETGVRRDNEKSVEIPRTVELACAALAMIAEKIEVPVYQRPDGSYAAKDSISDGDKLLGDVIAPRGTKVTTDDEGRVALAIPALSHLVPLAVAMNRGQTSIWMLGWKPFPT